MDTGDFDAQIAGVASLAEPQRRNLYRFVVSRHRPVSKDEAAGALGLARSVAAFHLDRLVADGLLVAEYRRLTGRSGPGAGRPAKLYRRSNREFAVTLPQRSYGLAADLLAAAVTGALTSGAPLDEVLTWAARNRGRHLGQVVRDRAGPHPTLDDLIEAALTVLDEVGYEPVQAGYELVMANCPFHTLAEDHRQLVCGINHDMLAGLAEVLPERVLSARLQPTEGVCCVRLTIRSNGTGP